MKRLTLGIIITFLLAGSANAQAWSWHDIAVDSDTVSGNGTLQWSVTHVDDLSYTVVDGDTMIVSVAITAHADSGFGNVLSIKLPDGYAAARTAYASMHFVIVDCNGDAADEPAALVLARKGDVRVLIEPKAAVKAPATAVALGEITIQVTR